MTIQITGMSKISTLRYKNKDIEIWLREKKGRHNAPYIVAIQPDGSEAHIQIKNQKIDDNTGIKSDVLKYITKWVQTYQEELLQSWDATKAGKALRVPHTLPKTTSSFKVKRIKEIKTNRNLLMLIRFEDNEIRLVDFNNIIPENPAFEPLLKPSVFMQAKANYMASAVRWDNIDIDMEATTLYEDSDPVNLDIIKLTGSKK
jgi:hypothetical protein